MGMFLLETSSKNSSETIALFDVSDVTNPKEVAKYEVPYKYSNSNALYDHKSFLFDRERNLLVMPMSYREQLEVTNDFGKPYPVYRYWQGAFVFDINLHGIELKGKIDHKPNDDKEGYYYSPSAVKRALYMDDVLYTISSSFIKANDLNDLELINDIVLSDLEDYPIVLYAD